MLPRGTEYLAFRASRPLLDRIDAIAPELIDLVIAEQSTPDGYNAGPTVASHLAGYGGFMNEKRFDLLLSSTIEAVEEHGNLGFAEIDNFPKLFPGIIKSIAEREIKNGFKSFSSLFEWYRQGIDSSDE